MNHTYLFDKNEIMNHPDSITQNHISAHDEYSENDDGIITSLSLSLSCFFVGNQTLCFTYVRKNMWRVV